ncbi:MAG TPA: hypothetical protein VGG42_00880 [Acidobacteriaceae bacterium]|jgi:hypothetical protein
MRPQNSRSLFGLLISGLAAGFLIAGSPAIAQNHGFTEHGGFAGHAGGFSSRGFSGSITGFPGRIATAAPHAIYTPGRAVFPASSQAFVPGFVPQASPAFQPAWRGREGWQGRGHDGDRDRDHDRGRRGRAYGGGYGYLGAYPVYGSSWELLPYDTGSDFSDDQSDQNAAEQGTAQPQPNAPPPDTGYGPEYPGYEGQPYPNQQAYAAPPAPAAPIAPEPELTLIFKDGHTKSIHNYVLTPSDLVVLDEAATGRQQRIPLDDLNLPATERAAQQAGLDFSPPI